MPNDGQFVETTVFDLMNGGAAADPLAQLEGFRFARPVRSFGAVPAGLYEALDAIADLDVSTPAYQPQTAADVDDLRYLWRRLGLAKEAGTGSRQAPLTWEDDAATLTDAELEDVREILERYYAPRLGGQIHTASAT